MSIVRDLKSKVSESTYKKFSKLIIPGGSRLYYLLDLGNGQYAAFWSQLIPSSVEELISRLEAGELIDNKNNSRPFIEGLSYITNVKADAIAYIKADKLI